MFTATLEGEVEFAAQIRAFEATLREGAKNAVLAAVKSGQATAKAGAFKNRTGALRERLYATLNEVSDTNVSGEIWASQPYASYVENGTEPHVIDAKRKKVLHWTDASGSHFARVVHHPGSKSIPFMGPAYQTAERVLNARMELVAAEAGKVFT